jgi:hypothetical protein
MAINFLFIIIYHKLLVYQYTCIIYYIYSCINIIITLR